MNIVQIILPLAILVVSVLLSAFLVLPKYENFTIMQASIQQKEGRIQRGEGVLVGLRQLQREIILRQEDFDKLEAAIPADNALPALYHDLQRIASESGLVLFTISSATTQFSGGGAGVTKTNATLALEGSYEGIKNFLVQIKSSERMLNVQSISLGGSDPTEGAMRLQVDIEAYATPIL